MVANPAGQRAADRALSRLSSPRCVGFQRDARLFLDDPGLDFIPLEHPRWQRIRAEHKNLYPHINASRPRPLDPVRYLIQTCWLLIGASRKETPKPRRRAFSGLQNIRGRYHQWMNELPERVSHKTQHLDEKKELGHLSAGARRLILGIIVTFSLILALICVTQPFNPLAQFIFLMLLWG